MSERREIRDPIFGFIRLDEKEADIVSYPLLQRLRRIRQLAFAHLVYPGALHTRFEHSLGVCHIAGLMAKRLNIQGEDLQLIRRAALVHDCGHGPFSHVSEYALEIFLEPSRMPADFKSTGKIHEIITTRVIEQSEQLHRCIGKDSCLRIAKLLRSGYGEPVMRSIVSGPLDADKQDYLLRDSYFCGVKYGEFDIHQLHRVLVASLDRSSGERHLMVAEKGIHTFEQFFLAKYYLSNQVYRHRVRLVTDQMLVRAIVLGIDEDKIEELQHLYTFEDSTDYINNYLEWDDQRFTETFTGINYKGTKIYDLLWRLKERRLLKKVFELKASQLEVARDPITRISEPQNKKVRCGLEAALFEVIKREVTDIGSDIALECSGPDMVAIHAYTVKSVRTESRNDEGAILVDSAKPAPFDEISALFGSINAEMNEVYVEVYAPVVYDTPTNRNRLIARLKDPIRGEIEAFYKGGQNGPDANP